MLKNEVFLLRESVLFAFDRRKKRLFHYINGERVEIKNSDIIGKIITSNAIVLSNKEMKLYLEQKNMDLSNSPKRRINNE